jgi:hypothetical protein
MNKTERQEERIFSWLRLGPIDAIGHLKKNSEGSSRVLLQERLRHPSEKELLFEVTRELATEHNLRRCCQLYRAGN